MPNRFYNPFRSVIELIGESERRYRDHQALSNMSDHQLSDIGLTRGDIATAIRTGRRPAR